MGSAPANVKVTFVYGEAVDPATGLVIPSPAVPNRRTGGNIPNNNMYITRGDGSNVSVLRLAFLCPPTSSFFLSF